MISLGYKADARHVHRVCSIVGSENRSRVRRISGRGDSSPAELWAVSCLTGAPIEDASPATKSCTVVDVFSGCGGFTFGVADGLRAAGFRPQLACAVDLDPAALAVYRTNLRPDRILLRNANSLVDFQIKGSGATAAFQYIPAVLEAQLAILAGQVDVYVAGPPCQGHSNLNNLTRRSDPRNLLYLTAASLGVALRAKVIVIENVPQVIRSHKGVVETAKALIQGAGYLVSELSLDASHYGCAQARRRHFLFAHRREGGTALLEAAVAAARTDRMPVGVAIGDLVNLPGKGFMDEPAALSEENTKRIRYLFEHDLYDLPNRIRPVCHQNGHTYPSVYGRMRWDLPAQTITSGFLSPGRGRFIHPLLPRALTLHEGARIQGFPDTFRFDDSFGAPVASRTTISQMIADAVPPGLGFVAGLAAAAILANAISSSAS